MSWLRLDDAYDTHPKLLELSELERWRWTRVLLHCARHRTQGLVSRSVLREVGLGRAVQKLIDLRLLLETAGADTLKVNDWDTFNPKDPTKAERQARWRASRRNGAVDADVDAPVDGDVDGVGVHSRVGTRARPVPVPQPVPQELDVGEGSTVAVNARENGHHPEQELTPDELEHRRQLIAESLQEAS
jgi:hypothetical protein